jgi:hypothetical protein
MQEQQGALTCSGVYSRAQRHVAGCLDCQEHHTPSCRLHTVQMYSCTFCTYRLVLLHLCTIHSSREALPQARCALGGHLLCLQCITHPVPQRISQCCCTNCTPLALQGVSHKPAGPGLQEPAKAHTSHSSSLGKQSLRILMPLLVLWRLAKQ